MLGETVLFILKFWEERRVARITDHRPPPVIVSYRIVSSVYPILGDRPDQAQAQAGFGSQIPWEDTSSVHGTALVSWLVSRKGRLVAWVPSDKVFPEDPIQRSVGSSVLRGKSYEPWKCKCR